MNIFKFTKQYLVSLFILPGLLYLASTFLASPVYAATFTVNSTTDAVDASPGNGTCATAGSVCTLRAAIQEANALAGTDTITLPAGTYTLTIAGTGEDASATGDLDITSDITINGSDESTTIIDAATIDRAIDMPATVTVTISNLTVKNGNVTGLGGGINNSDGSSTLTLSHVTLTNNTASSSGGGIDNEGTAVLSHVTLTNNQGTQGGIDSDGTLTISDSLVDSNIGGIGGGIWARNITATNLVVSNNTAAGGAGMYIAGDGGSLTNVAIIGNIAGNQGGGGLITFGNLTVNNLTVSNNQVGSGGGGISLLGNSLTLINSTITGNTSTQVGGGIYVEIAAITLTNTTIANNSAPISGGAGIYLLGPGDTATLKNTILSSNTVENCAGAGTFTSSGHNLSSDSSCSASFNQTGDLNSTNPLLSSLADNGGSVQTMALQSGSPAIDGGTNTGCTSTDARGTSRPQDGDNNGTSTCDIGAYEYVYVAASTPTSVSATEDKCPQVGNSWVGIQATVPNGVGINDKGQCYDLPTTTSSSPKLPNTGIDPNPLVSVVGGSNILDLVPAGSGFGIWILIVLIHLKQRFSALARQPVGNP